MSDKNSTLSEQLTQSLALLFREAYEGPAAPDSVWFGNNEPNSGILGVLEGLSAEEASFPLGEHGSSVAAHTEHLRWSLALVQAQINGQTERANWEESWSVSTVDDGTWEKLRADLRGEFDALVPIYEAGTDWSKPYVLTGSIAVVAHAAYHLGAIRQIAYTAKKRSAE